MTQPHTLTDPYNRRLSYLRLSVTDLCNYRCTYCLPDGYQGKAKPDELTLPEIETLVGVFAAAGTRKIRLTGGEPTLRRDLADIIAICKANPLIENVALTTNAFRLAKLFPAYRAAGLDKINISIDSFDPDVFFEITGKRECTNILRALDNILAEGFCNVKVNTLLLRRYAERTLADALDFVRARPVTLRFIELMQTGDNGSFFNSQHLSAAEIERGLQAQGWQLLPAPRANISTAISPAASASSPPTAKISAKAATACALPPKAKCTCACSAASPTTCAPICAKAMPKVCAVICIKPLPKNPNTTICTIKKSASSPTFP